MDTRELLTAALSYHSEGLCVIPVVHGQKMPAVPNFEHYYHNRSTADEVKHWFSRPHNIGIVHGEVSGNYITLDIDHDAGIFQTLQDEWSALFFGRVEQSGSGEGYHIPLRVENMPEWNNRTWKTPTGAVNIRARLCQTVAPPSIHPSGGLYRFLQTGSLVVLNSVDPLVDWLNELAPPKPKARPLPAPPALKRTEPGTDLKAAVEAEYPDVLSVFAEFGMTNLQQEKNGEIRILGNGGLLVAEDRQRWVCYSDDNFGGGIFEAWGWCRFGRDYDNRKQFREVLLEMARSRGIDTTKFYRQGDGQKVATVATVRKVWHQLYANMYARLR